MNLGDILNAHHDETEAKVVAGKLYETMDKPCNPDNIPGLELALELIKATHEMIRDIAAKSKYDNADTKRVMTAVEVGLQPAMQNIESRIELEKLNQGLEMLKQIAESAKDGDDEA